MKKLMIALLCMLFSIGFLQAQIGTIGSGGQSSSNGQDAIALPTIVPPAPTVASLMRFEEVPVDLYSGQASIGIPLGNVAISDMLNYPIGIQYNTQGVRIDERSGWLGTGFSMPTGGVISRTVRGLPDENNSQALGFGVLHNNYRNFDTMPLEEKEEFLWKTANGNEKYDSQYDLYQYNFFGRSGRFIVKNEFGQLTPVIIGSDPNHKITIYHNASLEITKFEVVDTSGYIYSFEETSSNAIYNNTVTTSQFGGSSTGSTTMGDGAINAWHLKDVRLPNNTVLCSFTYQNVEENYNTPTSTTKNLFIGSPAFGASEVSDINKGMLLPKYVNSSQLIYSTQKYVDEVTMRDGSKIKYHLALGHPEFEAHRVTSANSGAKLHHIEIFEPNGDLHKRIDFSFTTSVNNRLFLTGVTEVFGTKTLQYTLDYNNLEELPGFGSELKDVWGYYNGDYNTPTSNNNLIIKSRSVNPEKITTGTLASITYPLSGKKEFTFESNDYSYQGAADYDYTKIPDNRQIYNRFDNYEIRIGDGSSATKQLLYIDRAQKVQIFKRQLSVEACSNTSKHRLSLTRVIPRQGLTVNPPSNGNYSGLNISDFEYASSGFAFTFDVENGDDYPVISAGWYFIELTTPQVEFATCGTRVSLDVDLKFTEYNLVTKVMQGGGLRIQKIAFTDNGIEKQKTTYSYLDVEDQLEGDIQPVRGYDGDISSGSYEANLNSRTYIKGKMHPFIDQYTCGLQGHNYVRTPELVQYQVIRDINEVLTPTTKGNYVGYKKVSVEKENSGNELYTFISPRDVQILTFDNINYPFIPVENNDYKRGVVQKKEVFDQAGKRLIEEVYQYTDRSSTAETSHIMYELKNIDCPWDQFYKLFISYAAGTVDNPSAICGDVNLSQELSVGTCHSSQDPNAQTGTDIRFKTFNYIKGILLPSEVIRKEFFYDENDVMSETLTTTKSIYNAKNRLKEKTTEFAEGGITTIYKEETRYPYDYETSQYASVEQADLNKMVALNQIEAPVQSKQYKNGTLIYDTQRIFKEFSPNVIKVSEIKSAKANTARQSRVQFHSYTNLGQPLEVSQTDGTRISYVWGYDTMYPIAKLENASYANLTSEQTTALTNAYVASNADIDTTSENALQLALEELRAKFPEAMVTTLTYDPMVGVTRTTDPRGYTSYFEYDPLHRLEKVKDADHHILSVNEYFYSNGNSSLHNYVKSTIFQRATTDGLNLENWDKMETINYADGLGRAKQAIGIRQGGNGEDIVTPFDYDDLGRQDKEFLPYTATSLGGSYHANMFSAQAAFYSTDKYENTANPYSEKWFEKSPLSRVLEQAAPGLAWKLDTIADTDHTIKMDYRINSYNGVFSDADFDNVKRFSVSYTGSGFTTATLNEDGYYLEGELYTSIVKDENWQPNQTHENDHTTQEFTDKLGRVVLKRTYNENERHDTYYIYDDYGNLAFVLPPLVDVSNGISSDELTKLCYQYTYDHRNRLIEKQLPAKEKEYIVYDKLDRPVLTQDANLRADNKWLFTKYDILGRVAYTGLVINAGDRVALQTQMDTASTYETKVATATTIGNTEVFYTNANYPNDSSVIVLTVNYYDDYLWDTENSFEANYDINQTGLTPNTEGTAWEKEITSSWTNAGFITDGVIQGDGYIEYTLGNSGKRMMVGLAHQATASQTSHTSIDYRIYTGYTNNRMHVYSGANLESIPVMYGEQGDVMRVERVGNLILFKKNGTTFHTITTSYTGPLVGSGSIVDINTIIEDIHIGYAVYGQTFTQNVKGLPTGEKVRTIGTNHWTISESYYDEKAQVVHATSKNEYLDTQDAVSTRLDFTGKVLESRTTHVKGKTTPIVTIDQYTYDQNMRLLYQTKQINGGHKELMAKSHYDELGQLTKKQVGGTLPSNSSYMHVSTNITVNGNIIEKSSSNVAWDAGLTTDTTIQGDGYVSFSPTEISSYVMVGLSDDTTGIDHYNSIDYAIYINWGNIYIYESGVNKGLKGNFTLGDVLKVERRGDTIYYLKNGEVFYISTVVDVGSTFVGDISMYSANAKVQDVLLVDLEKQLQEVDFTYNVRGWLKGINDVNNQGDDLFSFALKYNDIADTSKQLFNGNISSTLWKTKGQDNTLKSYVYEYDALNRITSAIDNTGNYNLNNVSYDLNGNIINLIRKGHLNSEMTDFDIMDNLSYQYAGNQLLNVTDASTVSFGFTDGNIHASTDPTNTSNDFAYDDNGNMVSDKNKNINKITYNYLNLPTQITFDNGSTISYIYDATGAKLEKQVHDSSLSSGQNTYYAGNYIYKRLSGQSPVKLTFFNTEEGYVEPEFDPGKPGKIIGFNYTYQYKDHLGNIRLSYEDLNGDGQINAATEIKEENHYYPFGLKMKGFNSGIIGRDHNYGYNGIEESNDGLGLDMLEMDMRQYDPTIARWVVLDPVTHHDYSPYQAFDNNPVFWADPSGADSQITDDGDRISFQGEAAGQAFSAIKNGLYESSGCPDCPNGSYEDETEWIASDGRTYLFDGKQNRWSDSPALFFNVTMNQDKEMNANLALSIIATGTAFNARAASSDGPSPIMDVAAVISQALVIATATYYSAKAYNADDIETVTIGEPLSYVTLYRGVSTFNIEKDPNRATMWAEAQLGIAVPNGLRSNWPHEPHMDMDLHAAGDNMSIYTSWTTNINTAKHFATFGGTINGVILMKRFRLGRAIPNFTETAQMMGENEWLVIGPVSGAKVMRLPF